MGPRGPCKVRLLRAHADHAWEKILGRYQDTRGEPKAQKKVGNITLPTFSFLFFTFYHGAAVQVNLYHPLFPHFLFPVVETHVGIEGKGITRSTMVHGLIVHMGLDEMELTVGVLVWLET